MRWVKARGGVTLAQSRADHPDMPAAAAQTGYVDAVLPCDELAAKLRVLAETPVPSNDSEAHKFERPVSAFDSAPQNHSGAWQLLVGQTAERLRRSTSSLMSAQRAIDATLIAIGQSQELLQSSDGCPASRREEHLKRAADPDRA